MQVVSQSPDSQRADRLWEQYGRTHDPEVRAAIIEQFRPLARSLARRFSRAGTAGDDLSQVAMLGLVKAVDRFDPEAHVRFSSFAKPTILGELRHHMRSNGWYLHVPRGMQELSQHVRRAELQLTERLAREPTPAELATRLEVAEEKVLEALALRETSEPASLDRVSEALDGSPALSQCLGTEDPALQEAEDRIGVDQALAHVPSPMRRVIRMRYMEQLSQREVARQLGLTPMRVCRLEKRGLNVLRQELRAA
jgi:RNA polymerase sigma-B factor